MYLINKMNTLGESLSSSYYYYYHYYLNIYLKITAILITYDALKKTFFFNLLLTCGNGFFFIKTDHR